MPNSPKGCRRCSRRRPWLPALRKGPSQRPWLLDSVGCPSANGGADRGGLRASRGPPCCPRPSSGEENGLDGGWARAGAGCTPRAAAALAASPLGKAAAAALSAASAIAASSFLFSVTRVLSGSNRGGLRAPAPAGVPGGGSARAPPRCRLRPPGVISARAPPDPVPWRAEPAP